MLLDSKFIAYNAILVVATVSAQRSFIRVDMQGNFFNSVPKGPLSSPGNSLSNCANACDMIGCRVFFIAENGTGSCHRVESGWFDIVSSRIAEHGTVAVYGDFKDQISSG